MAGEIHFISGLPRSGSTLLSALLRQNPRLHAGMGAPGGGVLGPPAEPVGYLFTTLMRAMSQEHATSVMIEDDARRRVLAGVVDNYYADRLGRQIVFDTNRGWCARMPAIEALWPGALVVALVRNPAWILDSVERLVRRNTLEPSGIFGFTADGTVYSRTEGLVSGTGMIGQATNALREAVFGAERGRLLLVRFETLTTEPQRVLDAVYRRIGQPSFAHDPENVEPDYEAMLFDARLGTNGLHAVGSHVRSVSRETILTPDLFAQFSAGAFWEAPDGLPGGVEII